MESARPQTFSNIVLSSRVRLARNIVDYPFPPVLNETGRREIIEKTAKAVTANGFVSDTQISDPVYVHALAEKNLVSREFADDKETHALFVNTETSTYIMVCEEDHIRIQAYATGLALDEAYRYALAAERMLNEKIRFAFDKDLGYLTRCPTNLGTAMRASVMMFLPALTMTNRMGELKSQLEKIGMTIRGMYGEGSAADACLYQISNQLSLGICEEDILRKTVTITQKIAEDEERARMALFKANTDALTDKIMRCVGILHYASMISSKEFFDCYTYARLGFCLGIIQAPDSNTLDHLLYEIMPANILKNSGQNDLNDSRLRDKLRAQIIHKQLQAK